jgi:cell division protein FtsQ
MTMRRGSARNRNAWLHRPWARIPAVGRKWLVRSTLAATCGVTLAALLWYGVPAGMRWAVSHPYFAIAKLDLDGNRRLTRQEVLDWIGVHQGTSIWNATPSDLQMRLESHPWIRRASVQRTFPRRLTITLQERRPVAIVRLDSLNYVDRAGHVLGPLRDDDSRDFPLITGFEDEAQRSFAPIGIHRALQFLRRCERLSCFGGVSEVHVSQRRGLTVFPQHTAVTVVLGWGSWHEKLVRSTRVLTTWEGQMARVATVDLSFRDLVVVKLRGQHHPPAKRGQKTPLRV